MKTNYGNWISTPMMKTFCFITVLFYALSVPLYFIFGLEAGPFYIALILGIAATLVTLYMLYCRYVFSFEGGGLMGRIHVYLLDHLPWDGRGVFKFAVKMLSKIADDVIEEAGYTADQIDWIVPHQANKRIIDSTAKHLGLSMDKVILTVQDHGNTSAASIPLALDVGIKNGQIKRGQNLLLEGIGGGFAWGAVLVKY